MSGFFLCWAHGASGNVINQRGRDTAIVSFMTASGYQRSD